MRTFIPSETALVLGGGGAKGAYEIGVFEALQKLGIRAGSVYGVSIGSINAAMYAQGRTELAAELWEKIQLKDLVQGDVAAMSEEVENLFGHPEKLVDLFTKYAQQKGVDITPMVELLGRYIDEDAIRKSPVRLSVLATKFPTMSMQERKIADMEPGSLVDWIIASSACFPILPMKAIGSERYIDGGFVDNTPVGLAVRDGARQIIAVDIGKHPSHLQYKLRPNVTYIRASQPLGGMMTFSPEMTARNRVIGFNDTLRAFGLMRGVRYAFDPQNALSLHTLAENYVAMLTRLEVDMDGQHALTRNDHFSSLFTTLEEDMPPAPDAIDYLLRGCEMCAQIAEINPAQTLTFEPFREELRARLPLEKAEGMLDSLLGGRIGVLFAPPQKDRKLVISCLYHLFARESTFSALTMHTLAAFPRELICALTLRAIL